MQSASSSAKPTCPSFPLTQKGEMCSTPSPRSEIGKDLVEIEFEPVAWQCMLNYGGVVRF